MKENKLNIQELEILDAKWLKSKIQRMKNLLKIAEPNKHFIEK